MQLNVYLDKPLIYLAPRAGAPFPSDFKELECQPALRVVFENKSVSCALANLLAGQPLQAEGRKLRDLAGLCCNLAQLHEVSRLLWGAYGEGSISDAEAAYLTAYINEVRDLRRGSSLEPVGRLGRGSNRWGSRFVPRRRPRSSDREASRNRRRVLGGSSALPPDLRQYYTEGQRAVLCVLSGEIKRSNICDLPIDKIAALAGVSRTTVQTTMHEARRLGHVEITERPQSGGKNLSNIVLIISSEWRTWLRLSLSSTATTGSNSAKKVSTTKRRYLNKRTDKASRQCNDQGSERRGEFAAKSCSDSLFRRSTANSRYDAGSDDNDIVKDAINVVRITTGRDKEISPLGLSSTRRSMLKTSRGLSLIDPYIPAYKPSLALVEFVQNEKQPFLFGHDARLRAKGVLADGPAGTGKTLGAKYVAREWGIPLFRIDATFQSKWVGETEGYFAQALANAEQAAPCVLLFDAIPRVPVLLERGGSSGGRGHE